MTHPEHHPETPEPGRLGPQREYLEPGELEPDELEPGEVDFTGAIPQRQDMRDLIGGAVTEADAGGGQIPGWGARAIARILADGLPPGSALHQFAVTGRADHESINAINAETLPISTAPDTPAEVMQWIDHLASFLAHQPHQSSEADQPDRNAHGVDANRAAEREHRIEAGIAEAAAAHREIALEVAMDIAAALAGRLAGRLGGRLAGRLGGESALARFADTGVGGYLALREEYLDLYADHATPPVVRRWIDWFGTFLVQRENTGTGRRFMNEYRDPHLERILVATTVPIWGRDYPVWVPATLTARDIIGLGARLEGLEQMHEPAFRAFLRLSDVNAADPGLIETFHETYLGRYQDMDALIDGLTEITDWQGAVDELTARLGIDGLVGIDRAAVARAARERWDIIEADGVLYVFEK